MSKTTKLTVAQFLVEWATLHPESKLNKQFKIGAKLAGMMNGAEGRTPKIPHETFLGTYRQHKATGCTIKDALFKTAKELDCYPDSKDHENDYRLLWQQLDRAKKALNKS